MGKATISVSVPEAVDVDGTAAMAKDGFQYTPRFYVPTGTRTPRHTGPRISVFVERDDGNCLVAEATVAVGDDGRLFLSEDVPATPRFLEEKEVVE